MSNYYTPAASFSRPVIRRSRNAARYRSSVSGLGPVTHTLTLMLIVVVMGLLYLSQVVKTSTLSYEVDALERKQTELVDRNQDLKVEAARLQSIERIRSSDVAKKLEQGGEVSYLQN